MSGVSVLVIHPDYYQYTGDTVVGHTDVALIKTTEDVFQVDACFGGALAKSADLATKQDVTFSQLDQRGTHPTIAACSNPNSKEATVKDVARDAG